MNKKRDYIIGLIALILTISSQIYFALNNPFDLNLSSSSVSGLVIAEENKEETNGINLKEKIILGAEWVLVMAIFLKLIIQNSMEIKEYDLTITKEKAKKEITRTDLDTLYNLLKEKKKIPVKALTIFFKVDEIIIISWAKVLEEAGLITIHYPNFGHPILILNEEKETNEPKR